MAIIDLLVHALRKSTSALEHLNKRQLYHLPSMFKGLGLIPSIPLPLKKFILSLLFVDVSVMLNCSGVVLTRLLN